MAVLILTDVAPDDPWMTQFTAQLQQQQPDLDLRVWPDSGNSEEIEIVLAWLPPLGVMSTLPNLKLVISLAASVDRILAEQTLPRHVPIVRLVSDQKKSQMAEYVTLATLLFRRQFMEYGVLQRSRSWQPIPPPESHHFTVGILGLGALGLATAQALMGMGFIVRGWSRTPKRIDGMSCFHGQAQFRPFLSQCHVLVCLLPLTPETQGILCDATFSALPQGAYLINVGRGRHLVEADLLSALASGQIAAACLDVFEIEPLPHHHPFWDHPRILVTPHIAADGTPGDAADYVIDVMARWHNGQPLYHQIDRNQSY